MAGKAKRIAPPEVRKYAPLWRLLSFSAMNEPSRVEAMPATTTMIPKVVFTSPRICARTAPSSCSGSSPRESATRPDMNFGIQNEMPPMAKVIAVIAAVLKT